MSEKYTYIMSDFFNNKVDTDKLSEDILRSDITIALDYINSNYAECDVWFKAQLTQNDITTLSGIVSEHDGEPIPVVSPPTMPDGRPIVRSDTRPLGTQTYFTCTGDAGYDDIGEGFGWLWDFSNDANAYNQDSVENGPTIASGYKAKLIHQSFNDEVYLKDGAVYFIDATFGSYLSMYVTVPSGNFYPNVSGTYTAASLGLPGIDMYAYATNDVFYVTYVNKHFMLGDCCMGDELNAEASSVSSVPAGWYFSGLVVTTEDNDSLKGHGCLELYRRSTAILPGGAFNGEQVNEDE